MNGLNHTLANEARIVLTTRNFTQNQNDGSIKRTFDKNGEVLRDHKRELEVYVKDEQFHLIPTFEISHFDSYRQYHSLRKERESTNYKPQVYKALFKDIPIRRAKIKKTFLQTFISLFL
jgi:hypothetical protein